MDSKLDLGAIVERNLVQNIQISGELVSVKSSGNTILGNMFLNTTGVVNGRHGSNNTFKNNSFYVQGLKFGLQAYGDNHFIIGNLLSGAHLYIPNGDITQTDVLNGLSGHPAARNQIVAGNTVKNGGVIKLGFNTASRCCVPAQNTTLAKNEATVDSSGSHTGTKLSASYDGDIGVPVFLTSDMVGPDAPEDGGSTEPPAQPADSAPPVVSIASPVEGAVIPRT